MKHICWTLLVASTLVSCNKPPERLDIGKGRGAGDVEGSSGSRGTAQPSRGGSHSGGSGGGSSPIGGGGDGADGVGPGSGSTGGGGSSDSGGSGGGGSGGVGDSGRNSPDPSKGKLGPVVGGYHVEWARYDRKYPVSKVPFDKLTHFIYAFIPICGNNDSMEAGQRAALAAKCAKEGKRDHQLIIHDDFAMSENYKLLAQAKAAKPSLIMLPSVGGWTLSDPFFAMASTRENRRVFIDSCLDFLRTHTFYDGIDLDWEYPGGGGASGEKFSSPQDTANYTALLSELRTALDDFGRQMNRKYLITAAVGAGPRPIRNIDYKALYADPNRPLLDYIFDMTYDYYGGWSGVKSAQAGLYRSKESKDEGMSVSESIQAMLKAGVPPKHIVLGIASYGRGWKNASEASTKGRSTSTSWASDTDMKDQQMAVIQGPRHTVDAPLKMWEAGVLDYKLIVDLKNNDPGTWAYYWDSYTKTPFLWDEKGDRLISYDDPCSVQLKLDLAKEYSLGGSFMWELDADTDNKDILNVMVGQKPANCPK